MTATSQLAACCICFSPSVAPSNSGVQACKQCIAFFRRTVSLKIDHNCIGNGKCAIHYERRVVCKKCRFEKCLRNKMKNARSHTPLPTEIEETSTSWEPILGSSDEELPKTIAHYTKMETELNIRRKLLHACPSLNEIFEAECWTPYNLQSIREYNYTDWLGPRTDVAVLIDYIKGYPDFERFNIKEKGVWYRYTAFLDYIINGANYSIRLGVEHNKFVVVDGIYIIMDPQPITVEEARAAGKFLTDLDENLYRTIVPAVIKQWDSIVLPMAKLKLSFEEFCLFKALVCWHVGSRKFTPETRKICDYNKNIIFEALLSVNSNPEVSPEERLGELLLYMGSILEELYSEMNDIAMISTFNLMGHDSLVAEILDFKKW